MVAIPATANAAVIPVPCNTPALIAAINTANANPGADTLNLAGCLYVLDSTTGPLPGITDQLTIHGNGSVIRRAAAAPNFRILTVRSTLNLDNITLTGGNASGDFGGAIAVPGCFS